MQNKYKQKLRFLVNIDNSLEAYMAGAAFSSNNWDDISEGLKIFGVPQENIMLSCIDSIKAGEDAIGTLMTYWERFFDAQTAAATQSAKISENYGNGDFGCDRQFWEYIGILRANRASAIEDVVMLGLKKLKEQSPDYYRLITKDSNGWYFEDNFLDGVDGENNSLITNRVNVLKNNTDRLVWLYENLADALSRRSLCALIRFWLTWDCTDVRNISLYSNDVVDTNVYPFYQNEVFVDCGSFIGDTVLQYINTVNSDFKRVYTYDISSKSIELIKNNLAGYNNVEIRHKGTGNMNGEMHLVGVDLAFEGNKLKADSTGTVEKVEVVRLDDDIKEPVSFIKIDCEGMDKETLEGARGLIRRYHPKLHVDSYHKLADIVDVPSLIKEIDPSYTLYLRLPTDIDNPPRFPAPAYMAI